jgi:hypothetical protein
VPTVAFIIPYILIPKSDFSAKYAECLGLRNKEESKASKKGNQTATDRQVMDT